MLKVICVKQTRDRICKDFNVSPSTISNALNFKRFCEQHSEIRSYAVNMLNAKVIDI